MQAAELKVDGPLGDKLVILRLARAGAPANRFSILGCFARVCKFYLVHSPVNLARTLSPIEIPCQ
ncbi:hypothetical protein ES705_25696 [subsurface metagenome]